MNVILQYISKNTIMMKDMLFFNEISTTLMVVLVFYLISYAFVKSDAKKPDESKKVIENGNIIHTRAALFVLIATCVLIAILIFAKRIAEYIFIGISCLGYIMNFIYGLSIFLRSVMLNTKEYEITEDKERTLASFCIVSNLVLGFILDAAKRTILLSINKNTFAYDLYSGCFTFMFYYTILFNIICLFLLGLHNFRYVAHKEVIQYHPSKISAIIQKGDEYLRREAESLTDIRFVKGENTNSSIVWFVLISILKLALAMVVYLLLLLVDSVLILIFLIEKTINILINIILKIVHRNPGNTLVWISKLLFIITLIFVFVVDQYTGLFSKAGSKCYEYLSSVIIIPLLISQIQDIRKKHQQRLEMKNGKAN